MQTVIGGFDNRATADQAVQRLVDIGFDRSDVHVECNDQAGRADSQESQPAGDRRGFFATLFGLDDDRDDRHAATWTEAVRRGSAVVVVDAQDADEADRAASLLHELGAVDVNERASQWRADGWSGGAIEANDGKVLDVVQEELEVGKRQMDRGGVRVVERMSQQPVREVVRLREERAVVDRRPVDRAATADDLARTGDATVEVREMSEEPVVTKRARVVEEVRVGKEVREREQTIEDNVRRKDVDVQRLDGTREERERAVASDRDQRGGERLGGELAERDRLDRKDKPIL